MIRSCFICLLLLSFFSSDAQFNRDSIVTDFVLYQRRVDFDKHLRNKTINQTFAQPLDSSTEENYREACWAVSQFLFRSVEIEKGFTKLFAEYTLLETATKRALLEAVYGVYPIEYKKEIEVLNGTEQNPKLFAMQVLYLFRTEQTNANREKLPLLIQQRFPDYMQQPLLAELGNYLLQHFRNVAHPTPDLSALFQYQKNKQQKSIYSFQRWNRDYPGLAAIQNADGSFCRDSTGKLLLFEQLARSASDLPYFITNGSTPQGIYSIQGTDVSHNKFIGPTPNIQLIMPNEMDSGFWHSGYDSTKDALANYLSLLPESWRSYQPITESFMAGKIGRTEIIAHGTTIDPDYFTNKPYYPLTPTMGCLCAKEDWNIFNGKFIKSDQFNLVNSFLSTPGNKGYLYVINIDNQQRPVTREEIERWIENKNL